MKINFITSNLAPFRIDWLDELAKYSEINIYYYNDIEKGVNSKYIMRKPQKCSYINLRIIHKYLFTQIKHIMNLDGDILLLDGYGFKQQIILIFLLIIMKREYWLTVDGGILKNEKFMVRKIKSFIVSNAKYIFSTCKITDDFLIHYGANKENLIRHGFTTCKDVDILKEPISYEQKRILRKELNISDPFLILFVGKFIETKGVKEFIFATQGINAKKVMIGGNAQQLIEIGIEKELIKDYTLIEFLEKQDILKYMDAATIFVLPTYTDVWGLVIIEALSRGLPVITTTQCVAGRTWITNGENGFLVPCENIVDLRKNINMLLDNYKLISKIEFNNLKRMCDYSLEKIALNDYREIERRIR